MSTRDELRNELAKLEQQRDDFEKEMAEITKYLMTPGPTGLPVGLKGNLVDREGFPRYGVLSLFMILFFWYSYDAVRCYLTHTLQS